MFTCLGARFADRVTRRDINQTRHNLERCWQGSGSALRDLSEPLTVIIDSLETSGIM